MSPVRKNPESLSRVVKIGAVVLVLCLGLWGCARKPASRVGDNTVLESKVTKLEQDLRTVSNARDKARKDLANLETEAARLQQEANEKAILAQEKVALLEKIKASQAERDAMHKMLVARTNDRDDLRQQVSQRIVERDSLNSRVDKLRKGMQQLMSQDDNPAANVPGTPGSSPIPAAMNAVPALGGNS
jgi:hypothetical protein